ncbi:hypothetical protein TMatcc_001612 [Talaromyces marneffei ATCC 18224]
MFLIMARETEPRDNCLSSCCGQGKEINSGDACNPQTPDQGRDLNKPDCCKDKPSPCCSVSCLDRIALRECEQESILSPNDLSQKPTGSACQSPDGKPCDQHRRSARAKYAATLEALGCICRALIALGQESCCPSESRSTSGNERHSTESSRRILRDSLGSSSTSLKRRRSTGKGDACSSGCCGVSKASADSKQCGVPKNGKTINSGSCCSKSEVSINIGEDVSVTKDASSEAMNCSKGCCSRPKINQSLTTEHHSSSGMGKSDDHGCSAGCCSTSAVLSKNKLSEPATCSTCCCSKPKQPSSVLLGDISHQSHPRLDDCCSNMPSGCAIGKESSDMIESIPCTTIPDLEKGITSKEHIILSVSGLTCTGCETKLKRALGSLQSVQNLKTSLVLSRAEFDLNCDVQSLDEVLKHLGKTTEFKCERIIDRGSRVDVIVSDAAEFMKQDWPRGVTEMNLIDDQSVNVVYDAKIIGARDLLEHGWDRPLSLAPPRSDPTLLAGDKHVRHMGYMTILSIILTVPVLVLAWAPLPKHEIAYGSASLALATIVQIVIAGPFYPKALKALMFSRVIEMDLLIVLSTSAAYIFSVVSFGYLVVGKPLATGEFFETSTLLVTLIMVGRYVTALARQKAVESISLRSLQTPTATLVDESGANEKEIDVRLLQHGDVLKILPDSKIPTDGTVIGGSSEVDESMITGEPIPVEKFPASTVVAGSVNGSGTLIVKLTRLPADNTISVIAGLVDQAKLSKPRIQDIADRVASFFVPVVITLSIITFVIWIAVGITVRSQSGARATTEAITYAITVLIVSCPCAIGLAVPMVIVIASGVAAERGVIFKTANSIEVAYKAVNVVFDKTGTLTHGKLTVAVEHISSNDYLPLLISLIGSNKHPISASVATHLRGRGISASTVTDIKVHAGKGVEGLAQGLTLRAGNSRWLNLSSDPQVQSVLEQGYTAFCFTINDTLAAVFGLEDSLRPDALETVTKLQERDISVHILSGDDDGPVHSIARQLGIAAQNVRSRCTPIDKQRYIQTLVNQPGHPHKKIRTTTIFVGDGTNDAIALASSTIGVHMNQETGSDVAQSAADVVLMRPSLSSILTMINISEKAVRRIKFNFGWSFVYNVFAILLGAGAFVDARIPPRFAGLGELVSVLPVVVAAVLLKWARV